jgi:hypothetical protein
MTPQSRVKNSHFQDFVEAGRNPGNLEVRRQKQSVTNIRDCHLDRLFACLAVMRSKPDDYHPRL